MTRGSEEPVDPVRQAFLDAGACAVELVAAPPVGANWLRPSSLDGWPVATLCGHLARGVTSVAEYLERGDPPDGDERIDAAAYFAGVAAMMGTGPDLGAGIAERAAKAAEGGQFGVVELMERTLDRLGEACASAPPGRAVSVFGGLAMVLDDYLVTRMIELCVHCDDLAVSIGVDPPAMPTFANELVSHTLVDVARLRFGEIEVLRALARAERSTRPISAFG